MVTNKNVVMFTVDSEYSFYAKVSIKQDSNQKFLKDPIYRNKEKNVL